MKLTADDVQTLVIPDTGHSLAEQAPDQMATALDTFLTCLISVTAQSSSGSRPDPPRRVGVKRAVFAPPS